MSRQNGFTLIEMMIVVAVMGILMAIAVPGYRNYIVQANATEAQGVLSQFRLRMEQFYMDNRRYDDGASTPACGIAVPPANKNFTFSCVVNDLDPATNAANGYLLTAVGRDAMDSFTYTIDELNAKNTTALPGDWSAALPMLCWVNKKGQTCS